MVTLGHLTDDPLSYRHTYRKHFTHVVGARGARVGRDAECAAESGCCMSAMQEMCGEPARVEFGPPLDPFRPPFPKVTWELTTKTQSLLGHHPTCSQPLGQH